jgi:hypothetical protein
MTIAIDRPDGPATAIPSLLAPATPGPVQTTGLIPGVPDRLLAIGGAGLGLLALILLFAARNRRRRMAAAPAAAPVPGAGAALSAAGLPAQTVAYLEAVENAPEHSGPIPIEGPNVALGRDPWLAQVHLSDHSVSRLHARIIATGGVYRLHDEGSAGGTYVNFERVGLAPRLLKDNDDIHLGRVRLRFHLRAPEDRAGRADAVSAGEPADGAETRI